MKKVITANWLWVSAIVIVCLAILWPLTKTGFYVSDDGEWMVIRLTAFFQSLREGQFPVRFLGRLNHSFGYPVSNFLYPGFLYLGSFFHILGATFVDSIKIILALSVIGSAIFIFYWLKAYFNNLSSFLGSLSFIFGPYLAFDLYKRGSVGEIFAMLSVAAALYSVAFGKRWSLPLAVGLLLISHNSLALMFMVLILSYLIIKGKRNLVFAFFIGIGLATFFWFPAFIEKNFVVFDQTLVSHPSEYFVNSSQVALLGLMNIFIFTAYILRIKKNDKISRFFLIVFTLSIFFALPISAPIWKWKPLGLFIQFPFRFLAVSLFSGAWLTASLFQKISKPHKAILMILAVLFWLPMLLTSISKIEYVNHDEGYYATNEDTTTVFGEYMPKWVSQKAQKRANSRVEYYQGGGEITTKTMNTQRLNFTVKNRSDSIVQINSIYYPGWGVAVDNHPTLISYRNPQGVMRIAVPSGTHHVVAEFRETAIRLIADLTSLIFGTIYVVGLFVKTKSRAETTR